MAGAFNLVPLRAALICFTIALFCFSARAVTLWNDLGATLVHDTGDGQDILGGAVKRDDTATDTLYFKFHVDPLSDVSTEEYFAGFELFDGETRGLAVGNAMKAWAYSAFHTSDKGELNTVSGDFDLHSSRPESTAVGVFKKYEQPRRGIDRTIVFKVQYVAGEDDLVTVWLSPDLEAGATETNQPENLTTSFKANCSFNEIHLRHGGGGGGWTFSDMAIATAFSDFVAPSGIEPGKSSPVAGRGTLPFTFRSWQREQGLPQSSVRALAQTREGYLWIGTDNGVTRFDGVRFVSFGEREGLRCGPVSRILEDRRGALWIGSISGGLTRWQDGKFVMFTTRDGLPADSITALAEDNEGRLWVGTAAGLGSLLEGRWTTLTNEAVQGKAITGLFKDKKGTLWVAATGVGVFQFQDGRLNPINDSSAEKLLRDPHCVLLDQSDRLWVGAGDDFVLCRDGSQWIRYRIPRHLDKPFVTTLAESRDGTVWAGSVSEGLFHFKDGKLVAINASSGMLDNVVESLLVDREENLWAGTSAGLNQLRPKSVLFLGQEEGLGYGAVQGLAEIAPGLIWAGKASDGLYRWEGRNFSRLVLAGLSQNEAQVNTVLATRDGGCWVASSKGLLHVEDPKADSVETQPTELLELNVLSLAEDREGAVWAGTREGEVWRLQGGGLTAATNLWQTRPVTAILPGSDGSMWVGTDGHGLRRYQDRGFVKYGKANGLLSDSIRALHQDAQGVLWIGTAGGGLARWQEGRFTVFTTREGLPDDTISQILEDDDGQLWLGSNRGIASVSKAELQEVAAGKTTTLYPRIFGRAEGMMSEECTGGFQPAGLKTKDGLLWFSTLKGLAVINPRLKSPATHGPSVILEEVTVDGEPVSSFQAADSKTEAQGQKSGAGMAATRLQIPPGKHRIELRYTGLNFTAPERVRFRYRMRGLDSDWVDAGDRRAAFYSYVPPGEHQFQVKACDGDGMWSESGASLELAVLRYFWQTWWFIGAAAAGLLVSVGGTVRFLEKRKVQQQLKHLERARALERERARIAQDLHDDLGASLSRISFLSDLAKVGKDSYSQTGVHVDKISQLAGQTLRALDEIVWAVRPGSDSLQSLVEYIAHFAGELFKGNGVRCRLDLPDNLPTRSLPPEMRHNIFLIAKEALTNAMKHAAASEVCVQVKADMDSLEVVIQDDGNGFDPASSQSVREGNGLGNMRRRAEAVGGKLEMQTTSGNGTTVRLLVNFHRSK
ncbi:MAG: two-component regulator propeller domain-containing protein [Verrucomicrobiales bacterium]|nr:two-component regulator propeller domain-containing protein [Verrucomicrobiales bacterium]